VCGPVRALLDTAAAHHESAALVPEPVAILPGSLGSWTEQAGGGIEDGAG
jgi:hypothetical protein